MKNKGEIERVYGLIDAFETGQIPGLAPDERTKIALMAIKDALGWVLTNPRSEFTANLERLEAYAVRHGYVPPMVQ